MDGAGGGDDTNTDQWWCKSFEGQCSNVVLKNSFKMSSRWHSGSFSQIQLALSSNQHTTCSKLVSAWLLFSIQTFIAIFLGIRLEDRVLLFSSVRRGSCWSDQNLPQVEQMRQQHHLEDEALLSRLWCPVHHSFAVNRHRVDLVAQSSKTWPRQAVGVMRD